MQAPMAARKSGNGCSARVDMGKRLSYTVEQIDVENIHLLCKDLPANPCRWIVARRTCFAASDNLKRKML
jgi:hypothetical protein